MMVNGKMDYLMDLAHLPMMMVPFFKDAFVTESLNAEVQSSSKKMEPFIKVKLKIIELKEVAYW